MHRLTDSPGGGAEKGTIVVRLGVIAAGYFIASDVVYDQVVGPALGVTGTGRSTLAVHGGLVAVTAAVVWWLIVRPLRRAGASEQLLAALHRALEMAETSAEALAVFRRVLGVFKPSVSSQLLLADSSQAHLTTALAVSAGDDAACSVESPRACPAIKRGQTLVFPSSTAIDACPKLADRASGPCSAICLPITVLGKTIGILHTTAADRCPPDSETTGTLSAIAGEIGERLGMIRAVAQSELQATTDPLTGLLNRRKLEDEARALATLGVPFSVAIIDLDHLKTINDTYGHQTGDRALALFARTLENTVRDHDLTGRYGGDEFVALFPRCPLEEAVDITDRVRQSLKQATESHGLPNLTCSAGVADSGSGAELESVLAVADQALLRAKAAGRDRLDHTKPAQLALA